MPHIELDPQLPGITALFAYRPDTAVHLQGLAEVLLRGPSTLSVGERELIAAMVSRGNECAFCADSHGAIAAAALDGGAELVSAVGSDIAGSPVSAKLRALIRLALAVREGGLAVTEEQIADVRAAGGSDREIHDVVLIAALFCGINRYVDGLGTTPAPNAAAYDSMARQLLRHGYLPAGAQHG